MPLVQHLAPLPQEPHILFELLLLLAEDLQLPLPLHIRLVLLHLLKLRLQALVVLLPLLQILPAQLLVNGADLALEPCHRRLEPLDLCALGARLPLAHLDLGVDLGHVRVELVALLVVLGAELLPLLLLLLANLLQLAGHNRRVLFDYKSVVRYAQPVLSREILGESLPLILTHPDAHLLGLQHALLLVQLVHLLRVLRELHVLLSHLALELMLVLVLPPDLLHDRMLQHLHVLSSSALHLLHVDLLEQLQAVLLEVLQLCCELRLLHLDLRVLRQRLLAPHQDLLALLDVLVDLFDLPPQLLDPELIQLLVLLVCARLLLEHAQLLLVHLPSPDRARLLDLELPDGIEGLGVARGGKDGVELVLENFGLRQHPVGLLLVAEYDVLQHSFGHAHQLRDDLVDV
mmetsp:Transcript_1481/g.3549  ORF Transcript_1481/g.3549 Transcript_1481/m.3549 type:complete len:403 (-) Transcript_1481:611-1819(-)